MANVHNKVIYMPQEKDKNFLPGFTGLLVFGSVFGLTHCRKQQMKNEKECLAGARLYRTIIAVIVVTLNMFYLIRNLVAPCISTTTLVGQAQTACVIAHWMCATASRFHFWYSGSKLSTYIEYWEDDILQGKRFDYINNKVKKYMLISGGLMVPFILFCFYQLLVLGSFFSQIFIVNSLPTPIIYLTYDFETVFATIYTAGHCALAVATAENIVSNMAVKFQPECPLKYKEMEDDCEGLCCKPKEMKCLQYMLSSLVGAVNRGNEILGFIWVVICLHSAFVFCVVLYLLIFHSVMMDFGYFLPYIVRVLFDVILMTQLTFFGQLLIDKKQEILERLRGMYNRLETTNEKLDLLSTQSYVGSATLQLNAAGFFVLGRSFLLSVIGTALTFFIVLVQFKNGD